MKGEKKTTVWLDTLTYLLIPLVVIIGGWQLIASIVSGNVPGSAWLLIILEVLYLLFHIYTVYHVYHRNKSAYFLLRILIVVTAVRTALEYANTRNTNTGQSFILLFLGYLAVCAILWVYPNELYFKARKHLFGIKNPEKEFKEIKEEKEEVQENEETEEEKVSEEEEELS